MPADQGDGFLAEDRDRLPWLEPAEPIEEIEAAPMRKVLALVLLGLVLLGVIVGGGWLLKSRMNGGGDGTAGLIAAPEEPYKLPADAVDPKKYDVGGKSFAGEGDAAFSATAGATSAGQIDPSKAPEMPMTDVVKAGPATSPSATAQPATAPSATAAASGETATPAPAAAPPAPILGGARVQLGAYNSKAIAEEAWKRLVKRFDDLSGARHGVEPVETGGRTLYRLRMGAADKSAATAICGRLRVAGENCWVVP